MNSTFTPVSSKLPADGKSTQEMTLTLQDQNHQPVNIDVKDISLSTSALKSAVISDLTQKSSGVYSVTVTAGKDIETITLTPLVNGITLSPAEVAITAATPDAGQSGIGLDKTSYVAGTDMQVTVTLKDAADNPVPGQSALLTPDTVTVPNATPQKTRAAAWQDNGDGTYTGTYTATTTGTGLKATVKLSGWGGNAESEAYAITAGALMLSVDKNKVKVGESINLTVQYIANSPLSFSIDSIVDRQGKTRTDSGSILINGTQVDQFQGTTDSNGVLIVTLTDPEGIGVKTTINVSGDGVDEKTSVIFTVLTSPDSDNANMWGHMSDTVTAGGVTFERPPLANETDAKQGTKEESNETWATWQFDQANAYCTLPTSENLLGLFQQYGNVNPALGWPIKVIYRSLSQVTDGYHVNVNLTSGYVNNSGGDMVSRLYITCLKP